MLVPNIDGVASVKQVGFDLISERGAAAAEGLPAEIVYSGDGHLVAVSSLRDFDQEAAAC